MATSESLLRLPVFFSVISNVYFTANWSPCTNGPSASLEWTSKLPYHHSFFCRIAAMPVILAGMPWKSLASVLTMSGEYSLLNASRLRPARQRSTSSRATDSVAAGAAVSIGGRLGGKERAHCGDHPPQTPHSAVTMRHRGAPAPFCLVAACAGDGDG